MSQNRAFSFEFLQVVWNGSTWDKSQRGSKKIFLVISIYPFLNILDMKNYKLSPFEMCTQVDLFHTTIFIYTILRQLYKISQKLIWDNYIKIITHLHSYILKFVTIKKGTMWIILCVLIFVTIKKELWDTHFYSIFILDVFYNEIF